MRFHRRSFSMIFFVILQLKSIEIESLTTSCKKNRFIDYNQMVETNCLIETCILFSNCNQTRNDLCPCKRAFVVRYNVTTEHEDDEDDEHEDEDDDGITEHLAVIDQQPDDDESIYIGESYSCFYDERDVTTVFWERPNRTTYFILLSLSLILVFAIILVPIIYLILIIEFTNPEKKKEKK